MFVHAKYMHVYSITSSHTHTHAHTQTHTEQEMVTSGMIPELVETVSELEGGEGGEVVRREDQFLYTLLY